MKTSTNPALIDYETVKAGLDELHARRAGLDSQAELLDGVVRTIVQLLKIAQASTGGVNPDAPGIPKQPEIFM